MKNKKILFVIILLSILLIIGGLGYFCYDKFINKEDEVVLNDEEESSDKYLTDNRELTDSEITTLLGMIDRINHGFSNYYPIDDMSKISNNDLFLFALSGVRKVGDMTFNSIEMTNYINDYFDDNIKLVHKDYNCLVENKVLYKYNSSNNSYSFVSEGHGHGGSQKAYVPEIDVKMIDSHFSDNTYVISAKVLYSNTCSDTCGPISSYYRSFGDSLEGKDEIVNLTSDVVTEAEKEVYREKLPITTYKFKKKDAGSFALISVEIN